MLVWSGKKQISELLGESKAPQSPEVLAFQKITSLAV